MSQMQQYNPYQAQGWSSSPAYRGGTTLVTDQRPPDTAVVVLAWVLAVLTFGYLLPWAIAATRGRSNQAAIGLLNFFLGWTFIGWVVTLVMACQSHQVVGGGVRSTTVIVGQYVGGMPSPGWYPSPAGAGQQYWDGANWTEHRAP